MVSTSPSNVIDVFLQPGDLYFGDRETRIRTVLGSCVSMVFWHPRLHVGGMCHYMLPCRPDRHFGELDGRYADEATALLFREMRQIGTQPAEYQVKVFGGGNMFPGQRKDDGDHVGARNVEAARDIVRAHGLNTVCEHLAGAGHRNVIFDVWSGNVWVKHQAPVQQAETPVPASASELRIPAIRPAANATLACVPVAA
jgi:chemotaxis protein CheD